MKQDVTKWAKKFDQVKHIPTDDCRGVRCGKYGALLGNNHASMSMPICEECKHPKQVYVADCIEHGEGFRFVFMSNKTDQELMKVASREASGWGGECISVKPIGDEDYPNKEPYDADKNQMI